MKGNGSNVYLSKLTQAQKDQLAVEFAYFMIDNLSTIRKTAKRYKVSKSTVHTYIHKRLPKIDFLLYKKVVEVMKWNFDEKHKRGGEARRIQCLMSIK